MTSINFIGLDRPGLIFMASWLVSAAECGQLVDTDAIREAYGRAADYETAHNARIVLAAEVTAA